MLGFTDGTKDGGYLMANFGIYKAKDELTKVSREFGIDVIFFDGRGGPPARGGGKTHKFYASMGENISDKAIELTVQGQTVSSNFGTIDAARYNIEQLIHAGIYNQIFESRKETFSENEQELMQELADVSFAAYSELKNQSAFLEYLENVSPLKFYAKTNIGSRPAKRGGASGKLTLDSLRAIPFVGAWSQMKQNVPGFYGVGTALKEMDEKGKLDEVTELYRTNNFFKALIDNCEMAMQKTFFPLTRHLQNDETYGNLWQQIYDEYQLCYKLLGIITEKETFMTDFPVASRSIQMREKIVLPLTTIQQYALTKIRRDETELNDSYEKLIVRCSFGIINAGRNSA
jgi:phosphoenolpyruvate carboxylase